VRLACWLLTPLVSITPGLQDRDHLEFVVRLKDRLPCRATLADQLCGGLEAAGFRLQVCGLLLA